MGQIGSLQMDGLVWLLKNSRPGSVLLQQKGGYDMGVLYGRGGRWTGGGMTSYLPARDGNRTEPEPN